MEAVDASNDEALLDGALRRLQAVGRIEYTGEFGVEITTFLPFVRWLHESGHLEGRKVVTYRGMKPYYFFLEPDQVVEKDTGRDWLREAERDWPSNSTYTATLKPWHRPPDYRAHYAARARRFPLPTLFIQNKFTAEWDIGPINYLPLSAIERLLKLAQGRFKVVFSRPGCVEGAAGYSADKNVFCSYPDLAVVDSFPDTLVLERMAVEEQRPYNELKLEILAGAHLFFSVQGGSSDILAAFGDSLLAVVHYFGPEFPHAYDHGPYKYLANPPPRLLVARDTRSVFQAVEYFRNAKVENNRVVLDERAA